MPRVCHISPVHALADNRVFLKECQSLRHAGYEVVWVVQHDRDEVVDGVQVIALRPVRSLLRRWLVTGAEAFWKAYRTRSALYHFHDPEFIPWALLLRLTGARVVYDIHEDYVSSVSQKSYIPPVLRGVSAHLAGAAERICTAGFARVIAERYYEERFPHAVKVLNYPILDADDTPCRRSSGQLIYTGNVHPYRGAHVHARIPGLVPGTSVSFIGKCTESLHRTLLSENETHREQLSFVGVGGVVPYTEISNRYREGEWLAGLAIFPPNEHLEKKELTKFFEYMQFGIPIIASNFPTWRRLVEENGCGICVDPNDDDAIAAAVTRLRDDPELWRTMSENGMQTVRQKYSWNSQAASLMELYERLLR